MAGDEKEEKKNTIKFPHGKLFILVTIIAIILGIILGIILRFVPGWEFHEKKKIFYLRFPGDLLINMQKMLILPLIVSSVISSLASLKGSATGKMGIRAVVYYLSTSLCAIVVGITLVLTVRPGSRGNTEISDSYESVSHHPLDAILDLLRNCFPNNLIEACFAKQKTFIGKFNYTVSVTDNASQVLPKPDNISYHLDVTGITTERTIFFNSTTPAAVMEERVSDHPSVLTTKGINVLGLVVFSIFFGVITSNMESSGRPLVDFFEALHQATLRMTMLIIWYSPIGIVFLIAAKLIEMQNPETIFIQLGFYILTVLVGLSVHAFITLPIVFFIITRKNPYRFMYNMSKALLTAWVTSSSIATLPITLESLANENAANIPVAKFIAPIGATVNIEGAGVYDIVAPIFIAQLNNIPLDLGQIITVSLTAVVACIGTGLPTDILITTAVALTAGGLPLDDIGIILSVDWLLDRFCTPVNVLAASYGVAIVEHLSRNDLERPRVIDPAEDGLIVGPVDDDDS